jgi:hypothetical protein
LVNKNNCKNFILFLLRAARHLEKMMASDSNIGTLSEKLSAGGGLSVGGLSGLQDRDYPAAAATGPDAAALKLTTRYLLLSSLF